MDHSAVQRNARLRDLLLREPSFELALRATRRPPYSVTDRQELEQAVLAAFVSIDRELGRSDHDPWINIYGVQKFLFRFAGLRNEGPDTSYVFTVNQDLFPERYMYNEHVSGAPAPSLPGLQPQPGQRLFTPDIGPYSDAFIMRPSATPPDRLRLRGQTNVIKLHGSFNWRTFDGHNVMVIGTEKTDQIAALPLLAWYTEIFKQVLNAGNVRLMIVGYGFGDEHVNAIIAEGVERHGVRVFIWDTASSLREHILAAPHGPVIWGGLISTASRPLIEVFPSNQAETEEYRRIRDAFFA